MPEACGLQAVEPRINAIPILCFDRARNKARTLQHPTDPPPGYLYGECRQHCTFTARFDKVLAILSNIQDAEQLQPNSKPYL